MESGGRQEREQTGKHPHAWVCDKSSTSNVCCTWDQQKRMKSALGPIGECPKILETSLWN